MTTDSHESILAEYAENPFIAKLPPVLSQKALYKQLRDAPVFDEKERLYPAYLRKHCIARLANCFLPQARQVSLAERLDLLLRRGYVGRNPAKHDYLHHLRNGLDRILAASLDVEVRHPVQNTASCFSLLGCSGVGKTVAMNRVLSQYRQVIRHDEPFSVAQVVWLRLEAPALGSLKQLCIDFFDAIDRLIGTDYVKRYATGVTVEQMVPHMAHVANLHALGALVIDEIQHLKGVKVGVDALMKFLVRLVNTIGVPMILIGTLGALPILQGTFSQARRSTGLGSLLWDRMAPDATWDHFLKELWSYQWTSPATELTPDLSTVVYDETQGVADLAVKLFMLVQLRVVSASEVRRHQSEELTARLFRQVAKEEFAMVRPMIEALRANDRRALEQFQDIRSLSDHVQTVLAAAAPAAEPVSPGVTTGATRFATVEGQEDLVPVLLETLQRMGLASDVALAAVQKAMTENTTGDPLALLQRIGTSLTAKPVAAARSKPEPPATKSLPPDDLRRLIDEGPHPGRGGYDVLLAAGVVRAPHLGFGDAAC